MMQLYQKLEISQLLCVLNHKISSGLHLWVQNPQTDNETAVGLGQAMDKLKVYDESISKLYDAISRNETDEPIDIADKNDFEFVARATLAKFLDNSDQSDLGAGAFQRLPSASVSAIVVNSAGLIREANSQALTMHGLRIGANLKECGLQVQGADDLAVLLPGSDEGAGDAMATSLIQVASGSGQGIFTVLASRLEVAAGSEALFLLLFSSRQNLDEAVSLIGTKFDLSRTEVEIARAFIGGTSLREISEQRGRSYTTIRNQFQMVLEKTQCGSQSDLVQFVASLSTLFTNSKAVLQPVPVRSRKSMTIPRPGGRTIEVLVSGDPDGTPILSLFSLFGPGVTPAIEKKLRARGIALISIWRPGFGGTSKPRKGEAREACLKGDVKALLDALEIESCPCLIRASASQAFYDLALEIPERITHALVVNGLVPRQYIAKNKAASKWTNLLMSASFVSYPVARLILASGERLLRRSGTVAFLQKMYEHSPSDCEALGDPDVAASILEGVEGVTTQGLDAGVHDLVSGFTPWTMDLDALIVPIVLYHGVDDPNVPLESVRDFASDHPTAMTLLVQEGGGQLCYTHIDQILDLLMQESLHKLPGSVAMHRAARVSG